MVAEVGGVYSLDCIVRIAFASGSCTELTDSYVKSPEMSDGANLRKRVMYREE